MPYFFILPAFALLFLLLLVGGFGLRFTTLKSLAPYAFGAALGAVPGLIGANALLVPLLRGLSRLPASTAQSAQTIKALALGTVVFIGPFVASAIGVAVGAVLGAYGVGRLSRRRAGN